MAFLLRRLVSLFNNPKPRLLLLSGGCAITSFCNTAFRNRLHMEAEGHSSKPAAGKAFVLGAIVEEDEPMKSEGLRVILIKPDSVAEKSNLKEDDLIVEVDGTQVKTLKAYKKAIAKSQSQTKTFKVIRDGKKVKIQVTFT